MSHFEWIEKTLGFLYNLFVSIVITLFYREGSEPRYLQEGIHEDDVQSGRGTANRGEREDTVDFCPTTDLKKTLEKVSEAIYRKFILDWHSPPETLQNQPLYKEINFGLESVFFNIKSRVRPLEEYEIIISVATRLTAHFQKKKKVTYRFKTRQEEVDFVRKHTKHLLDYWLPESMKRSQLLYVFITEILSVNVLEQSVNNFSAPTFINEAIVEFLNDNPTAQQKKVSGRCDKKNQGSRCSATDETSAAITCSNDDNPSDTSTGAEAQGTVKKRKKGFIKRFTGIFKRNKPKPQKLKSGLAYRSLNCDGDVADMGSCDGNEGSDDGNEGSDDGSEGSDDGNEDSDNGNEGSDDGNDDNDREDGITSAISIINTTIQKWQQNYWTAKVTESLVENEFEYVISVYDESAPDTVLWNTKRRAEDFKLIYDKLCQKYSDFQKFTKSDTTRGDIRNDRPFFRSIGTTPDKFINILLDLIKTHQDTEAVFFFSPFDYEDDVKELPCSEDEHISEQSTTNDESSGDSSNSEMNPDYLKTAFRSFCGQDDDEQSNEAADNKSLSGNLLDTSEQENKSKNDEESIIGNKSDSKDCYKNYKSLSRSKQEAKPSTSARSDQPSNNLESTSLNPQKLGQKGLDVIDQNIAPTMEQQEKKLQKTVLIVIYQLVDEVLAGGVVSFWHSMGCMKKYSKDILNHIPDLYAEKQIIWYLNQVAELLMSELCQQELTPKELQEKALDVLKTKVRGFVNNYLLQLLLEEKIMKNLKASHQALQDPLANKETLYGLLEDLTKIITNDHQ